MFRGLVFCVLTGFAVVLNAASGDSASRGAVKVSERFGFDPADATRHIQAALNSGLPEIVIDAQKSPWVVRPLFVRTGQRIVFEKGAVLQAKRGAFKGRSNCLFTINDCRDVEIVGNGALLRMWRDDYARGEGYRRGEWRHALVIKGSERITVTGLRIEESGGDGIYISKGRSKAKDIVVRDCVCDRHHRQGLSIISGENILVENCVFKNTRGTPPEDGIDIEPNDADDHCVNIVIRNCVSENNTGKGFEAALTHLRAGIPVSIRFENCRSIGDRFGVKVRTRVHPTKGDYPTGSVVFDRCSFSRTKNEAITVQQVPEQAYEVRFDDCSFERIGEQAYDAPLAVLVSLFGDDPRPAMPKMTNMHWPDRGDRPLYRYDGMNFGAFGVETLPLKRLDLGSVRVADSSPGKFVAFPPMSIRSRALCHVYADSARDIRVAARQIRCGETETGEGTVDILTARGKKIGSCVLPVSDGTNIVFRAPAAGFYSLAFNVGKNAIAITGSDAPIAVDTRRLKPQRAMKREVVSVSGADGSFFVPMVSGERAEFRIQGSPPGMYEGAPQRVSVSVIDPSGNAVYSHPAVLYAEHFLTPPASEDGIWELRLKCAGDGKNGNSYYEIAGVSPLLFLTKEKVWYSNLKKGSVK